MDSREIRAHQLFSEIKPTRGFEEIALQIQSAIYAGKLKVGDRLPNERDLGQLFGVSRATLREAFRLLEAIGVLEVRRGTRGGAFIVAPAPERAGMLLGSFIHFRDATSRDLTEFRETFEAETAFWAAERVTAEESQRLEEIVQQISDTASALSWDRFVEFDLQFHQAVAEASKNQIRVAIMLGIHEVFRKSALAIEALDGPAWRAQQIQEIREIADAVRAHRADDAQGLMRRHVQSNVTKSQTAPPPS